MELHGHIQNGMVAIDGNPRLPEGAEVTILIGHLEQPIESPSTTAEVKHAPENRPVKQRVEFPLVRTGVPGSLQLTNEKIHDILAEQEIAFIKSQWNVPS